MNTLPAKYLLMTAIALVAMGCRKAHYAIPALWATGATTI